MRLHFLKPGLIKVAVEEHVTRPGKSIEGPHPEDKDITGRLPGGVKINYSQMISRMIDSMGFKEFMKHLDKQRREKENEKTKEQLRPLFDSIRELIRFVIENWNKGPGGGEKEKKPEK